MTNNELFVDNFAGGGGASTGIEMAIGRSVDIAINHDPDAIAMHEVNHPDSRHYCEDVWDIDPVKACAGRPVALAWFSPDCKHFSKAKGGKPCDKNIRGLAWVTLRWAATVKPRMIALENVTEIQTWGPLDKEGQPIKEKSGCFFRSFIRQLEGLGYKVEWRILKSCDYGAPTTRTRFYLIARRDGKTIKWPEPTHGPKKSREVQSGKLKPYRTAAECIDWSIPTQSIFGREKPLAENTMKRIARGIEKYVINNPDPFIVNYKFNNDPEDINNPLSTITSVNSHYLVAPSIIPIGYGEREGQAPRISSVEEPLGTVVSNPKHYLIAPTIIQYHSEQSDAEHRGQNVVDPMMTVDTSNRYGLATAHILTLRHFMDGQSMDEPLSTITASGAHHGEVVAFLVKYYGDGDGSYAQSVDEPLHTITTKDRFGLITINGEEYQIIDIQMRMLQPKELFAAQGFPPDYIIDRNAFGTPYPKSKQVARCGNAVTPPVPAALVRANLPEYCKHEYNIAAS